MRSIKWQYSSVNITECRGETGIKRPSLIARSASLIFGRKPTQNGLPVMASIYVIPDALTFA